jgi:hypothetical protein
MVRNSGVRFRAQEKFDLPGRTGILVSGQLLTGEITGGMTLRNEMTGQPVKVIQVEFATPATHRSNRITLLVDRGQASVAAQGAVLTSME